MSVPPVPSEQPAGVRTRPGTVTGSAILMALITAVSLVFAALTIISAAVLTDDMIRDELTRQQPNMPSEQLDTTVALFKPSQYAAGALMVVFAIVLAVLAVLIFKGSRVGRILTWVVTGLYAFCGLCLAGGAVGGGGAIGAILPALMMLGSLTVIILLALPASNRYFAKPVPQWQPPAEFGAELNQFTTAPGTGAGTPAGAGTPGAPPQIATESPQPASESPAPPATTPPADTPRPET
ncbi:MAG: hypothetical protein ACRDUA_03995, partial [Micromonosporaceae bacterium]